MINNLGNILEVAGGTEKNREIPQSGGWCSEPRPSSIQAETYDLSQLATSRQVQTGGVTTTRTALDIGSDA